MEIRAIVDEHSCNYCKERDGLKIKEDTALPLFPEATEEIPEVGCASELGCRCVAVA